VSCSTHHLKGNFAQQWLAGPPTSYNCHIAEVQTQIRIQRFAELLHCPDEVPIQELADELKEPAAHKQTTHQKF